MKKKINNIFLVASVACIIVFIVLVCVNIPGITINTTWVHYIFLTCLFVFFLCLNLKFRKYTDFDETLGCIRRTKKAFAKIEPDKDITFVKLRSLQNQLANSRAYLDDLSMKHDLYDMQAHSDAIGELLKKIKKEDSYNISLSKEEIESGVEVLSAALERLKTYKEEKNYKH